jgi:hypothetical protein
MGGAWGKWGMCIKLLSGNLKERGHIDKTEMDLK